MEFEEAAAGASGTIAAAVIMTVAVAKNNKKCKR